MRLNGLGMFSSTATANATVNAGPMLWGRTGCALVNLELTSGARVAHGKLVAGDVASVVSFSNYKRFTGSLSVAGAVDAASSGVGSKVPAGSAELHRAIASWRCAARWA